MNREYHYDNDGQREIDDRRASKVHDLARAGIFCEAQRLAGKVDHLQRSTDLIDWVKRREREERIG